MRETKEFIDGKKDCVTSYSNGAQHLEDGARKCERNGFLKESHKVLESVDTFFIEIFRSDAPLVFHSFDGEHLFPVVVKESGGLVVRAVQGLDEGLEVRA